jgi:hypothetical protein
VASIKGDKFERVVPSHNSATITAQAYVTTYAFVIAEIYDAVNSGEQLAFRMDLIDANTAYTQISGTGYLASGTLSAPRGLVVQDFEMMVDGEWTITVPPP